MVRWFTCQVLIKKGMLTARAIKHHLESTTLDSPRSVAVLSEELELALLSTDISLAEETLFESYSLHPFKTVVLGIYGANHAAYWSGASPRTPSKHFYPR